VQNIHWLGHDTFWVDGPPIIYIDPFHLHGSLPKADIILITHEHFDHCSPDDIAKIHDPKTVLVGPKEVAAKLKMAVMVIAAGETLKVGDVQIRAIPAYNVNKKFHPQQDGKVGYVFTIAGKSYYHAGDTDQIPEMNGLAPDVAFLPVSGTYVMTGQEAAVAARAIKPKLAIPMHYGEIIGSDDDAKAFVAALKGSGIQTLILRKE